MVSRNTIKTLLPDERIRFIIGLGLFAMLDGQKGFMKMLQRKMKVKKEPFIEVHHLFASTRKNRKDGSHP